MADILRGPLGARGALQLRLSGCDAALNHIPVWIFKVCRHAAKHVGQGLDKASSTLGAQQQRHIYKQPQQDPHLCRQGTVQRHHRKGSTRFGRVAVYRYSRYQLSRPGHRNGTRSTSIQQIYAAVLGAIVPRVASWPVGKMESTAQLRTVCSRVYGNLTNFNDSPRIMASSTNYMASYWALITVPVSS